MKKILVITLALVLALSLAACGGGTSAPPANSSTTTPPSSTPDTTQGANNSGSQTTEPPSSALDDTPSGTPESPSPTVIVSGEVSPVDVEIDDVPSEAKMGIGNPLYAMELSSTDPFAAGWLAAYDAVSQDDFDKYSDYFDALPDSDKSGESGQATYNFDWGAVQIAYNAENKQLNVTWLVH